MADVVVEVKPGAAGGDTGSELEVVWGKAAIAINGRSAGLAFRDLADGVREEGLESGEETSVISEGEIGREFSTAEGEGAFDVVFDVETVGAVRVIKGVGGESLGSINNVRLGSKGCAVVGEGGKGDSA